MLVPVLAHLNLVFLIDLQWLMRFEITGLLIFPLKTKSAYFFLKKKKSRAHQEQRVQKDTTDREAKEDHRFVLT